jgi:S-formylglutathione hydrolase FrmB
MSDPHALVEGPRLGYRWVVASDRPPRAPARRRGRVGLRRGRIAVLAAVAIAAAVAVAGASRGGSPGPQPTGAASAGGVTYVRYTLRSRFVDATLPQIAAVPPGARGRPLLVFLHGRGAHGQESNVNAAFARALASLGDRAPAVVFPSGGVSSYWHARASGDWSRYVLGEVIPQAVRRLHADPRRIAIGGISMGGYGAFHIARLRPGRFCAVGGHSAAFWLRPGDAAPGAFDDAADYARNDVVVLARTRGRAPWGRARLWLDGGTNDPFRVAGEAFAASLRIPMRHWPGGHSGAYWRARYGRYLRFYADALAAC